MHLFAELSREEMQRRDALRVDVRVVLAALLQHDGVRTGPPKGTSSRDGVRASLHGCRGLLHLYLVQMSVAWEQPNKLRGAPLTGKSFAFSYTRSRATEV